MGTIVTSAFISDVDYAGSVLEVTINLEGLAALLVHSPLFLNLLCFLVLLRSFCLLHFLDFLHSLDLLCRPSVWKKTPKIFDKRHQVSFISQSLCSNGANGIEHKGRDVTIQNCVSLKVLNNLELYFQKYTY